MQPKSLPLAAALFAAGSLAACETSLPRLDEPRQDLAGPAARAAALADPADTVLRLMDRRSDGGGLLQVLLEQGAEPTRVLAARALGTLPHPEFGAALTRPLTRAVETDPEPAVRAQAALALGLRGDPAGASALRGALEDPSPLVRARAVLGASLLAAGDAVLRGEVLRALGDPSEEVRAAAAVAPQRWPREAPDAGTVDEALLRVLARGANPEGTPEGPEVTWRVVSTLARRASERARADFLRHAHPVRPALERLFAVQGLAALADGAERGAALARALEDPDWRVASEAAAGLERGPDREALAALLAAAAHPSHHVRQRVAAALGALPEEREASRSARERLANDRSSAVRAAAIEAEARLAGEEGAADLAMRALDRDPFVRAGVARATRHLSWRRARPILQGLVRDEDRLVAGAAVSAAGAHLNAGGRELARAALGGADVGLRLAAVTALGEAPAPEDLAALSEAYRRAAPEGAQSASLRTELVKLAVRCDPEAARELLLAAALDPLPHLRTLARAELAARHPELELPPAPTPQRDVGDAPAPDLEALLAAPLVEIVTTRGRMIFELLPEAAPFHAQNFLDLARAGHYAGTRFHRVVPDFVVQGGDPRGDGNGGPSARGVSLRAELSHLEYARGSLGMPRADDLDGGGCQIFVTHRPTPHLDLRYTLFGRLRSGGDVLDALDLGDRILEVRLRGEPAR